MKSTTTIKIDGQTWRVRYEASTTAECLSFHETVDCLTNANDVAIAAEMGEFEIVDDED